MYELLVKGSYIALKVIIKTLKHLNIIGLLNVSWRMIFTTANFSCDQLPDGLHALTRRNHALE